jgi:hypothetical protein
MRAEVLDVICLLCGSTAGQVVGGRFAVGAGCGEGTAVADPRRLRCCRCGGSVYLEPAEPGELSSAIARELRRASA